MSGPGNTITDVIGRVITNLADSTGGKWPQHIKIPAAQYDPLIAQLLADSRARGFDDLPTRNNYVLFLNVEIERV